MPHTAIVDSSVRVYAFYVVVGKALLCGHHSARYESTVLP